MSNKSWAPHPATLAYRVIAYLKELPRGKFVATGPLAAEMCQPSAALITALLKPVEHGYMFREKRDGFYHWALTDEGWDLDLDGEGKPVPAKPSYAPTKWVDEKPEVKPATLSETVTDDTRWGDTEPEPVSRKQMPAPASVPLDGVDMDRAHAKPKPAARSKDPEPVPGPADPEPVDDEFRFSWSSDGVLTVEKAGQAVSMQQDEFQKLSRFIDVIGRFKP